MTNRLIMAAVGAVIYVIIPLVAGAQFFSHIPRLAVWGATSGLIIYEILYQTREWINLKTIALYFAGFLIISDWLFTPVLFIFEPEYFQWSWLIPSFDRMVDIFFPIYGYRWSYIFATGLTTAVGYYRVTRDTPSSVSSSAGGGGISSYGSAEMDFSRSQTTRYLLGSVLLNASFRTQIMNLVKQERNAFAPELGIDLAKLARISFLMDVREKKYHICYFIIAIVAFLSPSSIPLLVLVTAVINFYKQYGERYEFIPYIKKKDYYPDYLENILRRKYLSDKLPRNLPNESQNLIIYKGFFPFVGAGIPIGGWTLSIDVNKPREEILQPRKVKPFNLKDLYVAIVEAINKLQFDGLIVKDFLFVDGKEIRDERWLLPSIFLPPIDKVDQAIVDEYVICNDKFVRHYKWIQIYDWSNEIVISFFLRFSRQGSYLFVEINRCVLTPLKDEHREVDRLIPSKWNLISLGLKSLVVGPFSAITGAWAAIDRIFAEIVDLGDLFFADAKQLEKERGMEKNKKFNYGAKSSLRTQVSSSPTHYFQVLDQAMYLKVIERQIIEGLNNFLKAHNIDTSDIREQENTILNSGVIMEGGKVDAKSVAVGTGSQASVDKVSA